MFKSLNKLIFHRSPKPCVVIRLQNCHSVFGIKDLIHQDKPNHFTLRQVKCENHRQAVEIIKRHYLPEHVLVRARQMNLNSDRALDEYLINVLKQGNCIFAMSDESSIAGVCVSFASSPVDPRNLRNYAFYRQDPDTKDFLYFTAKLQETPNLWEMYKQTKVFEIKMLTVLPEYRRNGLAVMLAERSKEHAFDQGYKIVRMNCINPYDYKIAERCMLQCIAKFPLHKLRGATAPYIKRSSEHNQCVRVYVATRTRASDVIHDKRTHIDNLIE